MLHKGRNFVTEKFIKMNKTKKTTKFQEEKRMLEKMKNLVVEEEGQALTEYGLIIALVAVLIVGSLITFREGIAKVFTDIVDKIDGTPTA